MNTTYGRTVYGRARPAAPSPPGNPLLMTVNPRAATLVSASQSPTDPFAVNPRAATLVS